MNQWEFVVNTGNPEIDRTTVENYRQQVAAQGMSVQVAQNPGGGLHVRVIPAGQAAPQAQPQGQAWGGDAHAQQQYGGQQQQPWGAQPQSQQTPAASAAWGGGAAAFAGGGSEAASTFGTAAAAPALTADRVKYLRKVYGLLTASALVAVIAGGVAVTVGNEPLNPGYRISSAPTIVAFFLNAPIMMAVAFGVLFVGTFVASWVSKVRGLNVVALFLVAGLMGLELAPMIYASMVLGSWGETLSASPVRDAGLMVLATFTGITAYVFVTRKDFSYLRGILSMGVAVVFVACLMAAVFQSEIFTLAVASVGALLSAGIILWVTSVIFRDSDMDDPVGDALILLVQLRNLFMFLLHIFSSSSD